jgi:hypothetical protein
MKTLFLIFIISCASCFWLFPPGTISLEGTRTVCAADSDCTSLAVNPCEPCGIVSVRNDEVAAAKRQESADSYACCCVEVECSSGAVVACVEGTCTLVPFEPKPISLDGTQTDCATDDECVTIAAARPCDKCQVTAIKNDELGRQLKGLESIYGPDCTESTCVPDIAVCVDGQCALAPADGE